LLHPRVPQPTGSVVYELLTGHPEREPGELVFVADLTVELRAWPQDTWTKVGVDPDQVTQAVIGCWQAGEVTGLQVDDLNFEETHSLTKPAMTYVRAQLSGRLAARLGRAYQRWLHPTSGRPLRARYSFLYSCLNAGPAARQRPDRHRAAGLTLPPRGAAAVTRTLCSQCTLRLIMEYLRIFTQYVRSLVLALYNPVGGLSRMR
jgi:hypothetical protein